MKLEGLEMAGCLEGHSTVLAADMRLALSSYMRELAFFFLD